MKKPNNKSRKQGFALVVTLSLMILLTVVAVGLLSLSSISLRSTSQSSAQAMAQGNARLALMLAIGDLQKSLGPDKGISVNASVFKKDATQPNLVGAWTSLGWQGPTGTAPSPDDKAAKFRGWLVSTPTPANTVDFAFPTRAPGSDSVWLSNPTTTGVITENNLGHAETNNPTMKAERVPLKVGTAVGGLAWMVSDNSTKVPLNLESANSMQLAENVANRTSPPSPRPSVVNDVFDNISEPGRVISMSTAVLAVGAANKKEVEARAQSVTTSSLGLLTNVVTGGLKTDLTPLLESTGVNLTSALGASSPYFPAASTAAKGDGAPTWNYLRSHYQLHQKVKNQGTGLPRVAMAANTDIIPSTVGIQPKPAKEVLLPVVAKLQIMFSLVSHEVHISKRIKALSDHGVPNDYLKYAVPHLVYDPVITLYNPYDVELQLAQLRIRVSDPPVGFQFRKNDKWLRPEFNAGDYHGLGRFQYDKEHEPGARKTFTFLMRNKNDDGIPGGGPIVLLPGEVKVFSAYVEDDWNWDLETKDPEHPRAFFDWQNSTNMGNRDNRKFSGMEIYGVQSVPGLDFRAGLQTDHLSYGTVRNGVGRPEDSMYPWERGVKDLGEGSVIMNLDDTIMVKIKPQRCLPPSDTTSPDFKVDIMAGIKSVADEDILRTFEFRLQDVPKEMSTTGSASAPISKEYQIGAIIQRPLETESGGLGGKIPVAMFTMAAKTTKGLRDDGKAWVFNNLVTEGASHDSSKIGNAMQSYDLRLEDISDFDEVDYDGKEDRGFFGANSDSAQGVSVVPMYRVPVTPAASLGDWIGSNLVSSSQFPRVNYPLGNSFANPLVPSGQITYASPMGGVNVLDHSYLMNAALWDSYYFSSACEYKGTAYSTPRSKATVLEDFFTGKAPMLNSRLAPYLADTADAKVVAGKLATMADLTFSKEFAKNAMIKGAFNINSDSVDAWRAVLSSLRDANVKGYSNQALEVKNKTAFVRSGLPLTGSSDDANPLNSFNVMGQIRWAGFRALTDEQIENLATLIVAEIRARGALDRAPSLSLADFVNRRIGESTSLHALKGILQTAIDKSKINDNPQFHGIDSNTVDYSSLASNRTVGLQNKDALNGYTADGAAPMLTQGDLLTGLAPIITARGDTFTIRSYGESRAANGTTVVARAWCEATVQRIPAFVDGTNPPETATAALSPVNTTFGRRFVITSFRWLNASEI